MGAFRRSVAADLADVGDGEARAGIAYRGRARVGAVGRAHEKSRRVAAAGRLASSRAAAGRAAPLSGRAFGAVRAADGRRRSRRARDTALIVAGAVALAARRARVGVRRDRPTAGAGRAAGALSALRTRRRARRTGELQDALMIGQHVLTSDAGAVRTDVRQIGHAEQGAIGVTRSAAARAAAGRSAAARAAAGRSAAARAAAGRSAAARPARRAAAGARPSAARPARRRRRALAYVGVDAAHAAEKRQTGEEHRREVAGETDGERHTHKLSSLRAGAQTHEPRRNARFPVTPTCQSEPPAIRPPVSERPIARIPGHARCSPCLLER